MAGSKIAHQNLVRLLFGLMFLVFCIEGLALIYGLPHIPAVLAGAREMWREGTLHHDIKVSLARCLIGWIFGSAFGIVLGLLTGRVTRAAMMLEGILVLFRAIPFIVLLPLTMRIFGLSEIGKIFLVGWAAAGICWVIVHQGSQSIPQHLVWRSMSLGASKVKWLTKVLLPSCHDSIYSSLRASLSFALIVIAVAELGGVYERSSGLWWSEGLGYRLFRSLDQSRDDLLMTGILTFAVLGITLDQIFRWLWTAGCKTMFLLRQRNVRRTLSHFGDAGADQPMDWKAPQLLKADGLSAGYDAKSVINGLRLAVAPGRTLSIVGPSGCGKTTLIRAIGRFVDGDFWVNGTVTIGSETPAGPGPWVGIVMQDSPVFEFLTVWENITFGNRIRGLYDLRKCWFILNEFGLAEYATSRASMLSGGQRQRLALGTALANQPSALLLDEPFGALDAITRRKLQHFFWQHVHGKVTAVFVTHDVEEALLIGDEVQIGVDGKIDSIFIGKNGQPPGQWEFGAEFAELRCQVISALEKSHEPSQKDNR